MTPEEEDYAELHPHHIEIPGREQELRWARRARRRRFAFVSVAVCLGLSGVILGAALVHSQRGSDEHITADALQREDLREGWKALGAAAAVEAQAPNAAPPPAAPVIVNVPAQAAAPAAQPPNVVVVNVPPQGSQSVNVTAPGGVASSTPSGSSNTTLAPSVSFGTGAGNTPVPAVPYPSGINYGTGIDNGSSSSAGVTPSQAVGNGSIPGSTPNPAFPNNGVTPSAPPTPGLPNGSPSTFGGSSTGLVGTTPASPGVPGTP